VKVNGFPAPLADTIRSSARPAAARGSGEQAAAAPVAVSGGSGILTGEDSAPLLLKVSGVELLAEGELLGT